MLALIGIVTLGAIIGFVLRWKVSGKSTWWILTGLVFVCVILMGVIYANKNVNIDELGNWAWAAIAEIILVPFTVSAMVGALVAGVKRRSAAKG